MQSICARNYKDSYALDKINVVSLRLLEAGAAFFCSLRLEVAARAKELSLWRSPKTKAPTEAGAKLKHRRDCPRSEVPTEIRPGTPLSSIRLCG